MYIYSHSPNPLPFIFIAFCHFYFIFSFEKSVGTCLQCLYEATLLTTSYLNVKNLFFIKCTGKLAPLERNELTVYPTFVNWSPIVGSDHEQGLIHDLSRIYI